MGMELYKYSPESVAAVLVCLSVHRALVAALVWQALVLRRAEHAPGAVLGSRIGPELASAAVLTSYELLSKRAT